MKIGRNVKKLSETYDNWAAGFITAGAIFIGFGTESISIGAGSWLISAGICMFMVSLRYKKD